MDAKEFEREDRYAVIKYKKLTNHQWTLIPELLEKFDSARVDCVVVEKDWPEYHLVWAMLEHRMAGNPVPDFNLWRQADDLQQRLSDAERRNAILAKAATKFMEYAESGWDHFPDVGVNLRAALKPTESGVSQALSDELASLFTKGFLDDRMVNTIVGVVRKHTVKEPNQ